MKVEIKDIQPATYEQILAIHRWLSNAEREQPQAINLKQADPESIDAAMQAALELLKLAAPIRARAIIALSIQITGYIIKVIFHKRKVRKFNIFQRAKHGWHILALLLQLLNIAGCKKK